MQKPENRKLSLEKLENEVWPEPTYDTHLVKRCHSLRKVPLEKLNIEDLRVLVGQQIGLKFLVNIAIEKLTEDVLAEGDFYLGDLLNSVTGIDKKYWKENPEQRILLSAIIKNNENKIANNSVLNIKDLL
ncbi:MAG: hypothetical protein H0W73_00660 [Bacteroidetes bacterium]|nr:hypothetical protein [Bacteroidota bacterium]